MAYVWLMLNVGLEVNVAEQVDYAKMVTDLKDNVPAFLVKMKVDAQLHRGKYLALLSQGFTEAQSLELCKQIY